MKMQNFVTNNKILSHLGVTYLGNNIGYHIGHFLSQGDPIARIIKGYSFGLGTSIACNLSLYYYYTHHIKPADDMDDNISTTSAAPDPSSLENMLENETINAYIEYYNP